MSSTSFNALINAQPPPLSIPSEISELSIVNAALTYALHGWFVIPVQSGTKNPGSLLGTDWPSKSTRDPDEIRKLFKFPNTSIALHAGKSGAIVFDVDNPLLVPELLQEVVSNPAVPFQSTRIYGNMGRGHYFLRLPNGLSFGNGLGSIPGGWGDIRCHNAVVLVAPSDHPAPDGFYKWQRTGVLPILPANLAIRLPQRNSQCEYALSRKDAQEFIQRNSAENYPEFLNFRLKYLEDHPPVQNTRHTSFQRFLCLVLKDSAVGLYKASDALNATQALFNKYKPSEEQTSEEFSSMVFWAMAQVDAMGMTEKNLHISQAAPHLDEVLMSWVKNNA